MGCTSSKPSRVPNPVFEPQQEIRDSRQVPTQHKQQNEDTGHANTITTAPSDTVLRDFPTAEIDTNYEGDIVGGKKHGWGKYKYPDGNKIYITIISFLFFPLLILFGKIDKT